MRTWSPNCKDELGTGYVLSLEHNVGLQGHAAFEEVTNLNGIYFATEIQVFEPTDWKFRMVQQRPTSGRPQRSLQDSTLSTLSYAAKLLSRG